MKVEPQIQLINVANIIPNRFQPRLSFDEKALQELAASIKEHGIIQPLVLRRLGDKFEIIAGERRYKAAQIAGLATVPALIAQADDNTSAEVAIVENLQRKDMSAIEEARSYKKLLDRGYSTQEELAKKMGISQSAIANKVRLLNLTQEVQNALIDEKISERHARSLLQINDPVKQVELLNRIISERMTVRQLDEEIKKFIPRKESVSTPPKPSFVPLKPDEEVKATQIQEDKELKEITKQIEQLNNLNILNNKNSYETFNIPTAEELNKPLEESLKKTEEQNSSNHTDDSIIEPGNISSAIKSLRETAKKIEEASFKIETEEFDFEDLYQIIIKIEK